MEGKVIFEGKAQDGTSLIIRYPKLDDTQAMLEYINTLSKEQTFIRFQGEELTYEFEEKYIKEVIQKITNHQSVCLLVFSDGKLIAEADIHLDEKILRHNGILGITVAKEYRGRGIGKVLMEKTLDEARINLNELKNITLTVFANNPLAIAMYEKFGFKEFGLLPEGIVHKGEFVDYKYMYKKIR